MDWAIQTLRWDDSTVSALARQLGADWHTLMNAIRAHAADELDTAPARSARLAGVDTLSYGEDTRHALQMLRSFLDGFCLIEPAGDMHTEDEIEASFLWLIAFVDRGLRELSDITRGAHSRTAVASISTSTSGSKR